MELRCDVRTIGFSFELDRSRKDSRPSDADQLTKSGVPGRTGGRSTRRGFSTSQIPSPAGSGSSRTRDASGSRSGYSINPLHSKVLLLTSNIIRSLYLTTTVGLVLSYFKCSV